MSEEEKFFSSLLDGALENLHTAMIVKIIEYDPELQKVDVKPILKKEDGEEYPMILNVPIAIPHTKNFYITMPYQKGDWGFVVFSERDFEDAIYTGEEEEIEHDRKHDITDAVFIGGIKPFSDTIDASSEDLEIAHKEMDTKIIVKENGEVVVKSQEKVYLGSEDASEGLALGGTLKEWLDTHTHDGVSTGTGTSSTPSSDSPNTSNKVVTE